MSDDASAPTVTTPDGERGTVLHWPDRGHFRVLRDGGRDVSYVGVTPVLLESGEVRLYTSHTLRHE